MTPTARLSVARFVASGGGIGLIARLAAGTAASAVAVLIGAGLTRASPWALPCAAPIATLGGVWAVRAAGAEDDPGWVVIDEVAGQWIAMLGLRRATPRAMTAAFLLFRLIDIGKPGPVAWADRRKSAFGVMADDVLAGALAAAVLLLVQFSWPKLLR